MKKYLLTLVLIELVITACTDRASTLEESHDGSIAHKVEKYMSVSLISPDETKGMSYTRSYAGYEDGSDEENNIESIRFYFYDENGSSIEVVPSPDTQDVDLPYYDWQPKGDETFGGGEGNGAPEKIVAVTIPLNTKKDVTPLHLVAIINPPQVLKERGALSLEELQQTIEDYQTNLTFNNFVMSNSVYVTENESTKTLHCGTHIDSENIYNTPEEARKHPVSIYVERVLARVDVQFSRDLQPTTIITPGGETIENVFRIPDLQLSLPENLEETPDESREGEPKVSRDIYVQFLGWSVTSTPDKSRLIKSINKDWNTEEFFKTGESWNSEEMHRSFWAINPQTINYHYFSFNDIIGSNGDNERAPGCYPVSYDKNRAYIQENANPFSRNSINPLNPAYPSTIIFAARLIDQNGSPLTFAQYEKEYYSIGGLKLLIANKLEMYSRNTGSAADIFTKITPQEIDFETAMEHDPKNGGPDGEDLYYVYFKLTTQAAEKEWYTTDNPETAVRIKNPNRYINNNVFPAKIWKDGYTYYFSPIIHAGGNSEDSGYYGVVRNHLYDTTIIGITKLGTPVYKPSEKIYPEEPDEGENGLHIGITKLQWRIVAQTIQLTW